MFDTVNRAAWHDTSATPGTRAAALLTELTLAEKVAQLGSTWPGVEDLGGEVAPMQDTHLSTKSFAESIVHGIGQITRPFGTRPVEPAEGARRLVQLQNDVVAASRLGIPAIAHDECLTGFTAWKATVFPTALAWGATFDPALIERMSRAIGTGMRRLGVHQGLSPVLDVVRDYRWGRVEETMGEDPYLIGETGSAYVAGLESAGIVATLKHFAGYSASKGARNHAPVSMGAREFRDVLLPPFEKALSAGGARSVMNAYTDVDGMPAAADRRLLTGILRDEWGFTGTVVSDYWSIPFLATMHRVAADFTDAAHLALEAGIDVELPHSMAYDDDLIAAVETGRIPEQLVDAAVLRVLTQKAELGLLDAGWSATADQSDPGSVELDPIEQREIARRIAEESIVLLDNDGALPITAATRRIAVIGPAAHDPGCLFGCYSFPNHVIPNYPDHGIGIDAPTFLDSIRDEFPDAAISHAPGTGITGADASGIRTAVDAAQHADLVVLIVGDRSGMFGHGTSGEGCDAPDLRLPGIQEQLVDAVLATGTPSVLVVSSGRPYALGRFANSAAAMIQAFFLGEAGGSALAGVLSGRVTPSGRLPVQIPRTPGSQPGTYLAAPLALRSEGVSNIDPSPLFPFGHGRSYTSFEHSRATSDETRVDITGRMTVSLEVTNTGSRAGTDVVQVYLSDPVATITRPVKRLVGFARVELAAGESRSVTFRVPTDLASFTGADMRRRVEPGELVLSVGGSASDDRNQVVFELTGAVRHPGSGRALSSEVVVGEPTTADRDNFS